MKTSKILTIAIFCMLAYNSQAQQGQRGSEGIADSKAQSEEVAPLNTYLIERDIPGAGKMNPDQLQGISRQSNAVLAEMGTGIQWLHSYVADDKVFCIYKAENEDMIREHARKGGFPVNDIRLLAAEIGPDSGGSQ